jgi:3-hydroxybutyryl-CoA dehydratase
VPDQLELGQRAEARRRFTAADVAAFGALAGQEGVPGTVPEPLIGALFSCLLGVELPGRGTNYLKQEMDFLAQAPVGASLVASVEITRLRPEKDLVDLATECRTEEGTEVCRGRALVRISERGRTPAPSR